jgi:methylthioribose-1-phosphate isomerase
LTDASQFLLEKLEYLRTSRPTAVNLFVATDSLTKLVQKCSAGVQGQGISGQKKLVLQFVEAAEKMLEDDISTNKAIGRHGAQRILELTSLAKVTVLTICNTGSLATAGYGTALGF